MPAFLVRMIVALLLPSAAFADTAVSALGVDGSALVLRLADGRELRGRALEGATIELALDDGTHAELRIASITADPANPEILRHEFERPDGHGGWIRACPPNAEGETWGLPLKLAVGHPGRDGDITLSCASSPVTKCVRWGYPPWSTHPSGTALAPLHAACVRMARADYCGDGEPFTKPGTSIDNYDDLGIQKRGVANDSSYVFEAGWAASGAVCVARTRWQDLLTREQLFSRCPRLAAVPFCDEATARTLGARMFNTSRAN